MKKAIILSLFLLSSIMSKAQFTLSCDASGRCNYTFISSVVSPVGSSNQGIGLSTRRWDCGRQGLDQPAVLSISPLTTNVSGSTITGTFQVPTASGIYNFRANFHYVTSGGQFVEDSNVSGTSSFSFCSTATQIDIRILKMDLTEVMWGSGNAVPAGDYYIDFAKTLDPSGTGLYILSLRPYNTTGALDITLTPIGAASLNGPNRWKVKVNIPQRANVKLRFQVANTIRLWPGSNSLYNYYFD